jgi:hypothetical protein
MGMKVEQWILCMRLDLGIFLLSVLDNNCCILIFRARLEYSLGFLLCMVTFAYINRNLILILTFSVSGQGFGFVFSDIFELS